jgi:hypothetical protein
MSMTRDGKEIYDYAPTSDLRSSALTWSSRSLRSRFTKIRGPIVPTGIWEMQSTKKLNLTVAWEVQDLKDFPVLFFFLSP